MKINHVLRIKKVAEMGRRKKSIDSEKGTTLNDIRFVIMTWLTFEESYNCIDEDNFDEYQNSTYLFLIKTWKRSIF